MSSLVSAAVPKVSQFEVSVHREKADVLVLVTKISRLNWARLPRIGRFKN